MNFGMGNGCSQDASVSEMNPTSYQSLTTTTLFHFTVSTFNGLVQQVAKHFVLSQHLPWRRMICAKFSLPCKIRKGAGGGGVIKQNFL